MNSITAPNYRDPEHENLPHVGKFSGGRSSAAMVIGMARSGALNPNRGDIVLFANTTAEHPETYEFASTVCGHLESEFGIPSFWYEFCTVEVAGPAGYRRRASYKLVRRPSVIDDRDLASDQHRNDGSAFEEVASFKVMLPNRYLRLCTRYLKVLPGISLLEEWFGGGAGPSHAGHAHGRQMLDANELVRRYSGKKLSAAEYRSKIDNVCSRPAARPAQTWQDFTTVNLNRPTNGPRPLADLWGNQGDPFQFVTLLGLRADEPSRVERVEMKNLWAEGAGRRQCRDSAQPPGELVYSPLVDNGISKPDIDEWWRREPFDLKIDPLLSNCVYCFMKGPVSISAIVAMNQVDAPDLSPSGIEWWANLESKYGRPADKETSGRFGFFDLDAISYEQLATGLKPLSTHWSSNAIPCACTD